MISSRTFADRRRKFFQSMEDGLAIFPNAPTAVRNHDTDYKYRPDSDFYYLTGFTEPNSVAVLEKNGGDKNFILFVQPKNKAEEIWTGIRAGVEGAKRQFGAHQAFPVSKLVEELPKLMKKTESVYYKIGKSRDLDARLPGWLESLRFQIRAGVTSPERIFDPSPLIHNQRLIKSKEELDVMRRAAAITEEAHHASMIETEPGRYEYEIEALLDFTFRSHGGTGNAYPCIVASGDNACILHYHENQRKMQKGDLLLVDAGAEYDYYACDVTRTFPVSGKFTPAQKDIYNLVLDAQLQCIKMVKPGVRYQDIHKKAIRVITQGLKELGLLKGRVDSLIASRAYEKFFMHRTGHWMGLDVHDCGKYYVDGESRKIEPGMVFTIEPGIYVDPAAKDVKQSFRGIGVRIEDDILVTKNGCEVLTKGIRKTVEEVEEICGW